MPVLIAKFKSLRRKEGGALCRCRHCVRTCETPRRRRRRRPLSWSREPGGCAALWFSTLWTRNKLRTDQNIWQNFLEQLVLILWWENTRRPILYNWLLLWHKSESQLAVIWQICLESQIIVRYFLAGRNMCSRMIWRKSGEKRGGIWNAWGGVLCHALPGMHHPIAP